MERRVNRNWKLSLLLCVLIVEAKETGKTASATLIMVMFSGMFAEIAVTDSETQI